ncbi:hypothetical protein EKK58_03575 [Candidatus Dependentiae bacterium]|nr:MAG: hypothetical protein EKK58_03575 [Candidatus Dependentiae bacterium]
MKCFSLIKKFLKNYFFYCNLFCIASERIIPFPDDALNNVYQILWYEYTHTIQKADSIAKIKKQPTDNSKNISQEENGFQNLVTVNSEPSYNYNFAYNTIAAIDQWFRFHNKIASPALWQLNKKCYALFSPTKKINDIIRTGKSTVSTKIFNDYVQINNIYIEEKNIFFYKQYVYDIYKNIFRLPYFNTPIKAKKANCNVEYYFIFANNELVFNLKCIISSNQQLNFESRNIIKNRSPQFAIAFLIEYLQDTFLEKMYPYMTYMRCENNKNTTELNNSLVAFQDTTYPQTKRMLLDGIDFERTNILVIHYKGCIKALPPIVIYELFKYYYAKKYANVD